MIQHTTSRQPGLGGAETLRAVGARCRRVVNGLKAPSATLWSASANAGPVSPPKPWVAILAVGCLGSASALPGFKES